MRAVLPTRLSLGLQFCLWLVPWFWLTFPPSCKPQYLSVDSLLLETLEWIWCLAGVASPSLLVTTVVLRTIHSPPSCSEVHLYFPDQRGYVRWGNIFIEFWLLPLSWLFSVLYLRHTPSRNFAGFKIQYKATMLSIHPLWYFALGILTERYWSSLLGLARFAAIWLLINSNLAIEVSPF